VLDIYTDTAFPVGRWFKLGVIWQGSNTCLILYDDVEQATTNRTASTPLKPLGSGTDSAASMQGIHGQIADLVCWSALKTATAASLFMGQTYEASLNGYVRGIELPTQQTTTHRTVATQTAQGEHFVFDDQSSYAEDLWAYWPITSNSHLRDYGPYNYQMLAKSSNMMRTSWYREGQGAMAATSSEYYEAADGDIWPVSNVTISCWLWNSSTVNKSAWGNDNAVAAERCNCHALWSDGKIYWDWGGNSEGTSRISGTPPSGSFTAGWNHVLVYAKEATGMGIWINGKLLASHTSGSTPARDTGTQGPSLLMRGGLYLYAGKLAEFAVWNRQLSDPEKIRLFTDPLVLRKYSRPNANAALYLPPLPVAPASNAYTVAARGIEVAQASDDIGDPFVPRLEAPPAKITAWFQADSAHAGKRLIDRQRQSPTMAYVSIAGSWGASKTAQGPVYNFLGTDKDVIYGEFLQGTATGISLDGLYVFGVEVLVKFHSLTGTQYIGSFGQHDTASAPGLNWGLRADAAKLTFLSRNSVNTSWACCYTNNNVLVADQWHHVIWWCDGTAAWGFFVDGVAVAKTDVSSFLGSAASPEFNLAIGGVYNKTTGSWENFLTGKVAFLRIYRSTITAPQAAWLAKGVLAGRDPLRGRVPAGPIPANIPGRHWVGEDSDWFTAANWSRAAGGICGAGVPGCDEPVSFDALRANYE
jgi:hypothetical protein